MSDHLQGHGRWNRAGFTLLEVVLGVALSLILAGLVFAFYQRAVDTRTIAMQQSQDVDAQRVIMDRITLELQNALSYSFLGIGLTGTVDEETQLPQMQFVTAALPGPAAWAIRKSTEDPIPPEQDLQLVTYRLNTFTDDDGQAQVGGLERASQKIITARAASEGDEIGVSLLSPDIQYLRLRYWNGSSWENSWNQEDLPLAVEVVMGLQPPPDSTGNTSNSSNSSSSSDSSDSTTTDCPPGCCRRVIFLPGGVKASAGSAIIRGLNGSNE